MVTRLLAMSLVNLFSAKKCTITILSLYALFVHIFAQDSRMPYLHDLLEDNSFQACRCMHKSRSLLLCYQLLDCNDSTYPRVVVVWKVKSSSNFPFMILVCFHLSFFR